MKSDSTEFIIKTNKDVDEWMDGFYTEGHKADFRLHCQWAWQEQERRHNAVETELLAALIQLREDAYNAYADSLCIDRADAAIAKAKGTLS